MVGGFNKLLVEPRLTGDRTSCSKLWKFCNLWKVGVTVTRGGGRIRKKRGESFHSRTPSVAKWSTQDTTAKYRGL